MKTCRWYCVPDALDDQEIGESEAGADQHEVEQHLEQPPPVEHDRAQHPATRDSLGLGGAAALEVDEEAGELDEQRERDEDADERDPVVAEDGVGERGRAEAGRDRRQQNDGLLLRQTAPDEPVGGVVLPALVDRPALAMRTAVTSAVSRIGTARTRIGSISVATVVSATFQLVASPSAPSVKPSTWLPESPMKTSAGLPRAEVEEQEAEAGEAEAEREDEQQPLRVDGDGVDGEEDGGDQRERARPARPCCRAG